MRAVVEGGVEGGVEGRERPGLPINHVFDTLLHSSILVRIVLVIQNPRMEVPIADVAERAGEDAQFLEIFLRDFYTMTPLVSPRTDNNDLPILIMTRDSRETRAALLVLVLLVQPNYVPIISGSLEIGTATSVDQTRLFSSSRRASILHRTCLRALHREASSSLLLANSIVSDLLALAIFFTRSMFSRTPAFVPENLETRPLTVCLGRLAAEGCGSWSA